ncbi:MAG TPA: hypothetical protein PK087_04210, partial [Bacilli bacterium]|nr:hypothetical protein [Bacilli bacterium]HPX84974.1 hypothetical protein [Bacilli bacterium]HQC74882.1 hypothetical protein [Bacilli bacterium]
LFVYLLLHLFYLVFKDLIIPVFYPKKPYFSGCAFLGQPLVLYYKGNDLSNKIVFILLGASS